MSNLKVSVIPGCLRLKDPYEAFQVVADMGMEGVHLGVAGASPFHPDKLDAAGRRKLLAHLRGLGLAISAFVSWGGGVDLGDRDNMREHNALAEAKKFLDMSVDLECRIWQAHVGVMPHDASHPRWQVFLDAMGEIAEHGAKVGACLAVETGPEPVDVVLRLMQTIDSPGLRMNYDPANLILWPGILAHRGLAPRLSRQEIMERYQPTEGVAVLAPYIAHVHGKDGICLCDETDPNKNWWLEVPLGEGWVDWPRLVELLRAAGYDGYYAIEREVGDDPEGDIRRALEFLRTL